MFVPARLALGVRQAGDEVFLHGKQFSRLSHPYRSTHMLGRDGRVGPRRFTKMFVPARLALGGAMGVRQAGDEAFLHGKQFSRLSHPYDDRARLALRVIGHFGEQGIQVIPVFRPTYRVVADIFLGCP